MLMPHSIIHRNACFAYLNKIWGIPFDRGASELARAELIMAELTRVYTNRTLTCRDPKPVAKNGRFLR